VRHRRLPHLRDRARPQEVREDRADEATLQASILGVEKKPLPHLLCVTNMMFHGIDVPSNIRHDNTLARPLRDYGPKDRVDVIVTNPPFGGMEEDGIEQNFPANFRTRETADLFLVLIMTLLKPGGPAALVLPDGTLFGEGIKTRIKEKLLEECNLHTVVRLPKGVFSPYTGIKTNLLFFTKGGADEARLVLRAPLPAGLQELLEDEAAPDRGVRAREEVVDEAQGDRPRVEGLDRRTSRRAATTSTSRTRGPRTTVRGTPTSCSSSTRRLWPRRRRSAISSGRASARRTGGDRRPAPGAFRAAIRVCWRAQ
jgi:hypothetical protein